MHLLGTPLLLGSSEYNELRTSEICSFLKLKIFKNEKKFDDKKKIKHNVSTRFLLPYAYIPKYWYLVANKICQNGQNRRERQQL